MTDAIPATNSTVLANDTDLALLSSGTVLWKLRASNAWYRRRYWVNIQEMRLHYEPSRKPFWCNVKQYIDIIDVKDARLGWKTGWVI